MKPNNDKINKDSRLPDTDKKLKPEFGGQGARTPGAHGKPMDQPNGNKSNNPMEKNKGRDAEMDDTNVDKESDIE